MGHTSDLKAVSDDELLRRLSELLGQSRRVEADLIAHIAEVDARGLYAREAASSMFAYCVEVLHLSEPEAGLRIHVARACLRHPVLLDMLRRGEIHLSGISHLAPVLTSENRTALLKRARHQSKRRIEEIVAKARPRPDSPAIMRRVEHRPDDVGLTGTPAPVQPSYVEPTASTRVRVHFTASADLREKLERLQALMRSSVPDGDLGKIVDRAVTEKLERLEARRSAKTRRPRKSLADTDTRAKSRHIPAAVRRAVSERDGGRCTYESEGGRRCTRRHSLEFHHREPFGCGGDHRPENLALMCRTHNNLMAEHDYGKEVMARHRRSSSPSPSRTPGLPVSRRRGHS
jgi:5-methylcytosine-specific restriction endonuclease McrA